MIRRINTLVGLVNQIDTLDKKLPKYISDTLIHVCMILLCIILIQNLCVTYYSSKVLCTFQFDFELQKNAYVRYVPFVNYGTYIVGTR